MSWFRKNQKLLMAVLVAFLMFSWGILPALDYFVGEPGQDYGEILGQSINPQILHQAGAELDVLSNSGLLDGAPRLKDFIMSENLDEEPEHERISPAGIWRYLVISRVAEKAGVGSVEQQVAELFNQFPPFMQDQTTLNAIRNFMQIALLMSMHEIAYTQSDAELWADYAYENHKVKINYIKLAPELFIPTVEIEDDEIYEFYETHKEQLPDPNEGIFGYMAPDRVILEYAYPDEQTIKSKIQVTQSAVEEYYYDNLEDFLIDETDESDEEEGETDVDENEENESGSLEENNSDEDSQQDEHEKDNYKPLSEVRDDIKEILLEQKMEEKKHEMIRGAMDELDKMDIRPGRPKRMEMIAGRFDLVHEVPETDDDSPLLSREDIVQRLPNGQKIAEMMFDREFEAEIGYPELIDDNDQPMIVQLLQRKAPEPLPFDIAEEQVREDIKFAKALGNAHEFADEIRANAQREGFETAVKSADKALAEKLDGLENMANNSSDEQEQEYSDNDEELRYLEILESDFISLDNPALEGTGRQEIIEQILPIGIGEVTVVKDGGRPPGVFVIEKSDEEPADPERFKDWLLFARFRTWHTQSERMQEWLNQLRKDFPTPSVIQ